jgi:hypothetical protein
MRVRPMRAPGLPAGPTRIGDTRASREGCRLPVDRPARGVELLFQLLVFAPQTLALRFRATQVLAQAIDFPALVINDLLRLIRRGRLGLRHAPVIADSGAQYKRKVSGSRCLCGS